MSTPGVPKWAPGTQYIPGAMVVPRSNTEVVQEQPYNNSFEDGLTNWTITAEYGDSTTVAAQCSASSAEAYDGTQSALYSGGVAGSGPSSVSGNPSAWAIFTNNFMAPVKPGQKISFSGRIFRDSGDLIQSFCNGGARIAWYNSSMEFLSYSYASLPPLPYPTTPKGMVGGGIGQSPSVWVTSSGVGIAPAGAAYAAAVFALTGCSYAGSAIYADYFVWDYTIQGFPPGLVFVATQPTVGVSGTTEPTWPLTEGQSVTDNTVVWNAEFASLITWTTSSILETGAAEPTWPTSLGGVVADNSIEWTATDGRITDANCPQSKIVCIGAAKVFAANGDIINFCATANPQDWTASQDAGFIPFGMNNYGNEDVLAMNLYRGNLVAFNSLGYQMWQIDPDPANMALLDAEPVGCGFNKSVQPVNNDLVFLSPVGIRSIGSQGSAGNLQATMFGKQIDPLVRYALSQLPITGYEPKSLYYSGAGQYWCIFGAEAYVLTINGTNAMSWTRYTFPGTIDYWTQLDSVLYLRSGDLVWQMDELQAYDDFVTLSGSIPFPTSFSWEYLDFGTMGIDKQMEGFDLVIKGKASISFGYSQRKRELATDWYEVDGDTLPGSMIPLPLTAPSIQVRMQFDSGQIAPVSTDALQVAGYKVAEWSAMNIYVYPEAKQ